MKCQMICTLKISVIITIVVIIIINLYGFSRSLLVYMVF